MSYMNKNAELKNGYNAYIDSSVDDMGTQMDVGLLLMEAGDTYVYEDARKEVAILLFSGSLTYERDGKKVAAARPDCFHPGAPCLLARCGTTVTPPPHAHLFPWGFPEGPSHSTYSALPLVTYLKRGSMQSFCKASVEAYASKC